MEINIKNLIFYMIIFFGGISLYGYAFHIATTPINLTINRWIFYTSIVCSSVLVFLFLSWLELLPKRPFFNPKITIKNILRDVFGYIFQGVIGCCVIFVFSLVNHAICTNLYTLAFGKYKETYSVVVTNSKQRRAAKTQDGFSYYIYTENDSTFSVSKDFFTRIDAGDLLMITPLCSPLSCLAYEKNIRIVKP